jgi:hypothetical protein
MWGRGLAEAMECRGGELRTTLDTGRAETGSIVSMVLARSCESVEG